MKEYRLCYAKEVGDFERRCEELLEQDYIPQGGPSVIVAQGGLLYTQAFVR